MPGVLPTGFDRKSLAAILSDIEAGNISVFGPQVIQTPQTPLGQINGLMADLAAQMWEIVEDTYQSYDPDQADGLRLEMLGRMRLLERSPDEDDASYRQAITNAGRARIDLQDLARAVLGVPDVSYSQVFVNDTDTTDSNGIAGHSVAVAVLGGNSEDIARIVRDYVVPGVGTFGNLRVDTAIDGFCRSIWLVRPVAVPITLVVNVKVTNDKLGCPPPGIQAIKTALWNELNGNRRLLNGQDVTLFAIRQAVECYYSNVEVVSVTADRGAGATIPVVIDFMEIATFALANITIAIVP